MTECDSWLICRRYEHASWSWDGDQEQFQECWRCQSIERRHRQHPSLAVQLVMMLFAVLWRREEYCFWLVKIDNEAVMKEPSVHCGTTVLEADDSWVVVEFGKWYIKLSVISILVMAAPNSKAILAAGATYATNSKGPRTDPCGTPHGQSLVSAVTDSNRTNCERSVKYDLTHCSAWLQTPKTFSKRLSSTKCATVSKAADKSQATKSLHQFHHIYHYSDSVCKQIDICWRSGCP